MSWQPVTDVEATDYDPSQIVRVKKMIWSEMDQQFLTQYFIRIYCRSSYQREDTISWLEKEFGPSKYQNSWWPDPSRTQWIWLADNLATFWQLKWGDTK